MLESPLDPTTAFVVSILYHYHTICALFHGHWLGLFGFGRVELRIDGGGLGVVAARSQSLVSAQKSHYDSDFSSILSIIWRTPLSDRKIS